MLPHSVLGPIALASVLVLGVSGCSSSPWSRGHTAAQENGEPPLTHATARPQYEESHEYEPSPALESSYAPAPAISKSGGSGSCCH